MLAEKADIELSLMHVKEISRKELDVAPCIEQWQAKLREVTALQQRVAEQFTVVQVYRSALDKDFITLLRVWACCSCAGDCLFIHLLSTFYFAFLL
jgi:hypothetical protein